MRKIKRLVSNKALQYLRGATDYQFRDRISKVVGDCIDQIDEFFEVLATVKDGKDGRDGKDGEVGPQGIPGRNGADGQRGANGLNGRDGVDGVNGIDGHTPYIKNGYWFINGVNTGTKAVGKDGEDSEINEITINGVPIQPNNKTVNIEIPTLAEGNNITLSESEGIITISATNTTYNTFVQSGQNAAAGLVPAPPSDASTTRYLREDGTWVAPPDNNTTYSASDFDIKDLADSTNLKAAWNNKL